jgi:hypothetical protein
VPEAYGVVFLRAEMGLEFVREAGAIVGPVGATTGDTLIPND